MVLQVPNCIDGVDEFQPLQLELQTPLPAIIFFITVLLSLPCILARLIFVVFIFLILKFLKIVYVLAFSIKGFGCQPVVCAYLSSSAGFSVGELFQQKIL